MADPRRYRRRAAWGRSTGRHSSEFGCVLLVGALLALAVALTVLTSVAITNLR